MEDTAFWTIMSKYIYRCIEHEIKSDYAAKNQEKIEELKAVSELVWNAD